MRVADQMAEHRAAQGRGRVPPVGPPVLVEASRLNESPLRGPTLARSSALPTQRVDVAALTKDAERMRVELMAALQERISDDSQIFELKNKGGGSKVHLGRSSANDVVVGDETVSSQHAVIEIWDRTATVIDRDSANGTFVNGRRLAAHDSTPLTSGDCLRLGQRAFYYLGGDRLVLFIQLRIGRDGF